MKSHGAAPTSLATGAFQKRNRGQIDPMVDRGLKMSFKYRSGATKKVGSDWGQGSLLRFLCHHKVFIKVL